MNVRFFAGTKAQYLGLPTYNPIALYFCADTKELFWGDKLLSDGIRIVSELPSLDSSAAAEGIIYYVTETHNGYVLTPDRSEWLQIIYAPVDHINNNIPVEAINTTPVSVGAVRELERVIYDKIAEVAGKSSVAAISFAGVQFVEHNGVFAIDQTSAREALAVPTKVSELENDKKYASESFVENAVAKIDLSGYATTDELDIVKNKIPDVSKFITEIPSEYITEHELTEKGYITEHQSLEGYATETFVKNAIAEAELNNGEIDTSVFATKDEIKNLAAVSYVDEKVAAILIPEVPTKTSELENDLGFITAIPNEYVTESELAGKGFLTEHQSLTDYAKKDELFSKDYNDLSNKPEIPSVIGLATEEYVTEAVNNIPKVDLSNYATKTEIPSLDDYAKTADIPDVSNFITEIPSDYITEEKLNAKGYLTEHQSLEGLASEEFVKNAIDAIDIPETDLSGYYTSTETSAAITGAVEVKANKVPFTVSKIVTTPIGTFQAGDDIKGLTIAQIFAKLLGFSDESGPEIPEIPQGIIETIMTNEMSLYQINDQDIIVEVPYSYVNYAESEAATTNDGISCFYTVSAADGTCVEAGYQHFSTRKEPYYITALPEELEVTASGNVILQTWDKTLNKWVKASYVLTSDYDEIVAVYTADGITPPVAPDGYKLWADLRTNDPGTSYRFIIKE